MSPYAITAQFYDAIADEPHAGVDQRIGEVLRGLAAVAGPVVDIGAGTGLTARLIAAALPEAEILAVEPDPSMRAALMTRVWSDPDLRRRVTILPMSVLEAPLPPVVSAMVASASLVHFDPTQRRRLWALLGRHLAPDGLAVIEVQCPTAQDLAETRIAAAQVGRVRYEGWARAERLDDERQRWHVRYVSRLSGAEIDRQTATYVCWAASVEQVLAEAGEVGLEGDARGELVVLRPGAQARRA